jgi:hypothetical protein
MIKFFRKIRQKMLAENKTRAYFKYAMGEIILVVLGILIALQINNWNENRIVQKQTYNQLLEVQNEILQNILEFDYEGNYYNEKLRDLRRVFSDTLVFEDYKTQGDLSNIMSSYNPVSTQHEAFNKLIQNAESLPEKYKPLVIELKSLYNLSAFEVTYKQLLIEVSKHIEFIHDFNESLYRHEYDDYYRFLMTNKDYKNKLASFSFLLKDITRDLARKKYTAIAVYRQMVKLGFTDKNMFQIEKMFIAINPETAAAFIGRYTNNTLNLSIRYNKKDNMMLGSWSNIYGEKSEAMKVIIKDTSTLNIGGETYLEFNDDKSSFFTLQLSSNPTFKRILEVD